MATARTTRYRPRKEPRQLRSRETRERILDAAAKVFARHGYAAGTTNRIAAAADLSVGSLYQYFPNKDAILVELARRHASDGLDLVRRRIADAGGLPAGLDERLRLFVDAVVENHSGSPRLHQVIFEEAPRPRPLLDELHAAEEWLVGAAERMLRDDPDVRVGDHRLAARLVVMAIESLTHRYVSSRPDDLDLDGFSRELVAMLSRYLRGE